MGNCGFLRHVYLRRRTKMHGCKIGGFIEMTEKCKKCNLGYKKRRLNRDELEKCELLKRDNKYENHR